MDTLGCSQRWTLALNDACTGPSPFLHLALRGSTVSGRSIWEERVEGREGAEALREAEGRRRLGAAARMQKVGWRGPEGLEDGESAVSGL